MVLFEHPKNMFKLLGKKIIAILYKKVGPVIKILQLRHKFHKKSCILRFIVKDKFYISKILVLEEAGQISRAFWTGDMLMHGK